MIKLILFCSTFILCSAMTSQTTHLLTTPFVEENFGNAQTDYDDGRFITAARSESVGGQSNAGAAYIFKKGPCGWEQEQRLISPSSPVSYGGFGTSNAIHGSYAAVGAPYYNSYQGEISIFERSGSIWSLMETIQAPPAYASVISTFAYRVSLHGNKLLAHAYGLEPCLEECIPPEPGSPGFVFLYEYNGSNWTFTHAFTEASGSYVYGQSNDVYDNTVVIGDAHENNIRIYKYDGTEWNIEETFSKPSGVYGIDVSLDDDKIVVGAYKEDEGAVSVIGASYAYRKIAGTWTEIQRFVPFDGTSWDLYGYNVDIQGDFILVAADQADGPNTIIEGAVYLYEYNNLSSVLFRVQNTCKQYGSTKNGEVIAGYYETVLGRRLLFRGGFDKILLHLIQYPSLTKLAIARYNCVSSPWLLKQMKI